MLDLSANQVSISKLWKLFIEKKNIFCLQYTYVMSDDFPVMSSNISEIK